MMKTKSEVIIVHILFEDNISFWYKKSLRANDGKIYLPNFTIDHNCGT